MAERVVLQSELAGLTCVSRGKVRDMYDLGDALLIVTTDRISAFDVVMANGIPWKGKVLNRLSQWWFDFLGVRHHMITCDVDAMPAPVRRHADVLRDRAMLVRKARVFPVECVARGYLIGSGWQDYQATGAVCGIPLAPGLAQAAKLDRPIFTPATKAATGHDENIGFDVVVRTVGEVTAAALRDLTLAIYARGAAYAETKGLILADTKLEFGFVDGEIPSSTRSSPPTPRATGRGRRIGSARRRRPSTSSSCATSSSRSGSTRSRRAPSCRRTSCRRRARNISKPTGSSPGASSPPADQHPACPGGCLPRRDDRRRFGRAPRRTCRA
jgi:phosphoribosylaminoimidazole-succinocarboxamide synthase